MIRLSYCFCLILTSPLITEKVVCFQGVYALQIMSHDKSLHVVDVLVVLVVLSTTVVVVVSLAVEVEVLVVEVEEVEVVEGQDSTCLGCHLPSLPHLH